MENKIYNAIQNALVIDSDANINYKKSVIDNNINLPEINDIYALFREFSLDNENIYYYNSINCLGLVLEDGQEISLHQYKGQEVKFIKITNEYLRSHDNDIYIALYADYLISAEEMQWQKGYDHEVLAKYVGDSLDGYATCCQIMRKSIGDINFNHPDAIEYCMKQVIPIGDKVLHGYLPSMKQMNMVYDSQSMINKIFDYLNIPALNLRSHQLWTCTERGKNEVYAFDYQYIACRYKDKSYNVMPFFHIKNINGIDKIWFEKLFK